MSGYLFRGDFRRRPNQNFAGNSRGSEHRETVIRRAEAERKRRERERAEQSAILKLQGFFRGCLDRKRIRSLWRKEFDEKKKSHLTDRELLLQLKRINLFFQTKSGDDNQRLLEIGKVLLANHVQVMQEMKVNDNIAFGVKKILWKCIRCLNFGIVPTAIFLRLIDTYTDPSKYNGDNVSDKVIQVIGNIWIDLVVEADLFVAYRKFLENKLPPIRDELEVNRVMESYDFLLIYKRIFSLKSELHFRNVKFTGKSGSYDKDEFMTIMMSKFSTSFTQNVIPLDGNNGIAAFFILPRLKNFVPWEDWLKIIPKPNTIRADKEVRNIFYTTLIFMRELNLGQHSVETLLQAICDLRISIDPENLPYFFSSSTSSNSGLTKHIEALDEDQEMEVDEDQELVNVDNSIAKNNSDALQECQMIYQSLKTVLNRDEIASWLCPFQLKKWALLRDIVGCVARIEPKLSPLDFKTLSALSYRRDFMRSLCLHCIENTNSAPDDLLSFCWFFSQLCATLHDAEFLACLPIQKEELAKLVVGFREMFCNRVLKESEWSGTTPSFDAITGTLMRIHDRNSRMNLFSEEIFISSTLSKIFPVETHSLKFEDITNEKASPNHTPMDDKLLNTLKAFPFALSFRDRVKVWNRLLEIDKQSYDRFPSGSREEVQIRRNFIYEDAFEKLSPENVPDLRKVIRISLVNVVGMMEAGIDGGGLLREFLTESTKAAVDPNRGLFRGDSHNRLYPNPIAKKLMSDFRKHFYVVGRLVGKALYEQTLLELPIAAFFMQYCIEGKVLSAVDFLATLDPSLHKNLLALKTYKGGDIASLGLDFTITVEELGQTRVVDLKRNGKDISVENANVIEYIHLVADYKINKEMEEECRSFRAGLLDVVPSVRMFSWKELQTLISGSDKPIDLDDWRANTNYGPEFNDNNPTVRMFWEVVKGFDEKCLRMLLKFVTSCSRPPLLGFKDLVPKFGLQSAGKTDRLPTASTCMNLLKLPEFSDITTMKEKLLYVINAHAGFELS